ncbi:MAG: hypothetical protein ACT4PJ_00485 [Gemmatimonadaceae bacterium]
MRILVVVAILFGVPIAAQQPDTTARRDSVARADSIARADSLRIVRELERIRGEARPVQPVGAMTPTRAVQPGAPSLNPNISVIGDFIVDASPDGSTLESARRFDVREIELALGASVDPYFRGDFILGLSDEEGIAIEEAYLTTLALPWQLQARVGRFHLPVGKQNTTHRAELHTIEYPHVIQRFLGAEGGKGTGLALSKIFAPFRFYQELQLTAIERFPEEHGHAHEEEELGEEHFEGAAAEPPNKTLAGLGYTARFRNYWDLDEATNVELSFSGGTGRVAEPFGCETFSGIEPCPGPSGETAVLARRSLVAADLTLRWRPLREGLYRSFIVQAEVMRQHKDQPALPSGVPASAVYLGPTEETNGLYVFSRWQLSRRVFVGTRYDWLEATGDAERDLTAISGYLQMFPSEFSKIVLGYEHLRPDVGERVNRLLAQMTIAIGPHRPHPF